MALDKCTHKHVMECTNSSLSYSSKEPSGQHHKEGGELEMHEQKLCNLCYSSSILRVYMSSGKVLF